jgi:hypothetical protein
MNVVDGGVDNGVSSLTPTDFLWANMSPKIRVGVTRDKTPYHG